MDSTSSRLYYAPGVSKEASSVAETTDGSAESMKDLKQLQTLTGAQLLLTEPPPPIYFRSNNRDMRLLPC